MERWLAVPDFADYEVSDGGRVRRVVAKERAPAKVLRQFDDGYGYRRLVLRRDGRSVSIKAHRLVALAFIRNPNALPQVNHKNGVRSDNRVENLEWVTNQGNARHAIDVLDHRPTVQRGESNGCAKVTADTVQEMRAMRSGGMTFKAIGERVGITKQGAWAACTGKNWGHL